MSSDLLEGNLRHVSSLDLLSNTNKLLLDVVLGGGNQHLLLDLGGIRSPDNEKDLGALSSVSRLEGQIVDNVTATLGGELVGEVRPVSVVGGLLDDNLGQIIVDAEDGILVLVAHLDVVEDGNNLIGDGNSGRHDWFFCLFSTIRESCEKKDGGA